MATYLISTQTIKDMFSMSSNIDDKWIRSSILVAQDFYLRGTKDGYDAIMGKTFFEAFCARFDTQSLTAAELLLVPYLRNVLTYMTMNEALPFMKDKIVNTGVQTQTPDQNTPTSDAAFYRMLNQIKKTGEYYIEMMKEYLCDNKNDFPEYLQSNNRPNQDESNNWPILTRRNSSCGGNCRRFGSCNCGCDH